MPKRRALYKSSPEDQKKSRDDVEAESDDVVIEMVHSAAEGDEQGSDEEEDRLQQILKIQSYKE